MITEGIIALIWAAAGVAFYASTSGLNEALQTLGQSGVVYEISVSLLGVVGGALAVVGVVACPITSGDTAFRSARLTLADWFQIDQGKISKRLLLTVPLLLVGAVLTQLDFDGRRGVAACERDCVSCGDWFCGFLSSDILCENLFKAKCRQLTNRRNDDELCGGRNTI